ncbi:MULE domain-containing protein, partial [Aphis craccivora]
MDALTNRNRQVFIHEGYQYIFDKLAADNVTKLYRCRRRDIHCKGRLRVCINGVIEVTGNHGGHDESPVAIEIASTITNIKKRALETMEAPAVAINQCIESLTVAGKGALTSINNLKQVVRRVRRHNGPQIPVTPLSLMELEIPEEYKNYEVEPGQFENFLLCDTGPGPNRILIFGRQRGLEILATSNEWFVDGTFKIAPILFTQVFVILGTRNGGVHPCIYALLPNKNQATYNRLLIEIKNLAPG